MAYLLLGSALLLSSIAAYFSVIGLSTIFPGSIISIIVMAFGLELAKIIVAVWAHQNWQKISRLTKFYLSTSVIVLMGITSMGIFGFLSKSHIEHSSSVSFSQNLIKEIDRKVALEEDSISRQKSIILEKKSIRNLSEDKNQKIIEQLTSNIESIYSRLDKDVKESNEKVDKLHVRLGILDQQLQDLRNQKTGLFSSNDKKIKELELSQDDERNYISSQFKFLDDSIINSRKECNSKVESLRLEINKLQNSKIEIDESDLNLISSYEDKIKESLSIIEELNLEKFELESKNLAVENELGPIKYISALIKDLGGPDLSSGGSIRLVIMLIVLVFDPLAIVMVICASKSFLEKPKIDKPNSIEPNIEKEDDNSEEIKVSELKMEADGPKTSHTRLPDGRAVKTKGNFKYLK